MKRYVSIEEISDGKLYDCNDMVKADCHGCEGCSQCCKGMGKTIILDPYDIYRLTVGLGVSLEQMLVDKLELSVVDGVILPNIKMDLEGELCGFLDENGRCSIHEFRPGICRLFPLGRIYEDGGFHYFLQSNECDKVHTKIKVSKWIDTPRINEYEEFVCTWHYFLHDLEEKIREENGKNNLEYSKKINMLLLQIFYFNPYVTDDFYPQFADRYKQFQELWN